MSEPSRRSARRATRRPSQARASAEPSVPLNSIAQTSVRERPASAPPKVGKSNRLPPSTPGGDRPAVPDAIRERFVGVGSKFYFPDGSPAFTDHGHKLSTRSENSEVIRSLLAIAEHRGWREIAIRGSGRFRKEAWFAAKLQGMDVTGYRPSKVEEAQLVRALARRHGGAGERSHSAETVMDLEPQPGKSDGAAAAPSSPQLLTGRLVDHGRAPYHHNPKEPMSYFVRLESDKGEREIWGVDLERAFRDSLSQPGIGDEVTLRAGNRQSVKVSRPRHDDEGRVVGKEEVAAHRTQWGVETTTFLAERAAAAQYFRDEAMEPAEAIKRFPALQGFYLQLQAAKLGAERDITHSQDRADFVARVRSAIAASIERGEPLNPVRLRGRSAAPAPDRSHTREDAPTR